MQTASIEAQLRTRAFARVLGPYIATFTTIYAIRLGEGMEVIDELFSSPALVMMLGTFMFLGGLIIIAGHRSWRGPLAIAISLFGWFVALRGVALIATPDAMQSGVDATLDSSGATLAARLFFAALAIMGLLLAYAGWFTKPKAPQPAEA
ncbi:hypothetical protein [Glycomyces harbinensis]|uniref:Uncharacterized protein n=1 Tax=Glycomyces harbinensis TaxID=58114 RepID=A0A1G6RJ89_9ACTN|nr:hypothetical protein [Glycomyces harbinensis]SDD04045.1 hypothetical protein SAMN05216270_101494 [Glycomyces harbinensis]